MTEDKKWLVCLIWDEPGHHEFEKQSADAMLVWLKANLRQEAWEHVQIQLREGQDLDSRIEVRVKGNGK